MGMGVDVGGKCLSDLFSYQTFSTKCYLELQEGDKRDTFVQLNKY